MKVLSRNNALNYLIVAMLYWCSCYAIGHEAEHGELAFTADELTYLASKKSFHHCIDPNWMPFEKNDNGRHVGITADYVKLIASVINVPIQFLPTDSWTETLRQAQSRNCDIVTSVYDRPDRRKYLNFTSSLYNSPLVLVTEAHRPRVTEISILEPVTVGVVKGYAAGEVIREQYSNLNFLVVNSLDEGLRKVANGELYGFVGTMANLGYEIQQRFYGQLKINGVFAENWSIGMGVRNDEPLLVDIFNKVIARITAEQHQAIYNRWLSVADKQENPTALNNEEKAFLKQHKTIRFLARRNRPPFDFEQDGNAEGIAIDYIRLVASKVGFEPKFVIMDITPTEAATVINGTAGPFDSVPYWVKNPDREQIVSFGEAYLTYPMMAFVNKSSSYVGSLSALEGMTVVLEKGFLTNRWLERDYPNIKVVNVNTTFEALTLLDQGKVDAYVGNLAIANYYFAHGKLRNVKLAFPTDYKDIEYRFVAPKRWSVFASILNKGYQQITPTEHNTIQQKWFSHQTIEKTDYTLVKQVAGGAGLVLALVFWWNRSLHKEKSKTELALQQLERTQEELQQRNIELTKLSTTDSLTNLNNRARLEELMQQAYDRVTRYSDETFSIILIDLDHFKAVNDNHGHQCGDKLLVKIAQLFLESIRKVDVVGRWGGEEFLIICARTGSQGAIQLAEHLRNNVENAVFSQVTEQTASFGVTMYAPGDTLEHMLSRADKALYKSKNAGRNRVSCL
jgi:diguanylate cyclase (GGDEF)-like protein